MRRVNFTLDGWGPFAGMMRFGLIGDGEVEFIAIGMTRDEMSRFQTIEILPEDEESFEAPIKEAVVAESCLDTADARASGYITFETL